MKKNKLLIPVFFLFLFNINLFSQENSDRLLTYHVDISTYNDDLFHVQLYPGKLSADDQYYNFTAYSPGVHQILDYGRFVKSFAAYDAQMNEIMTQKISTNKWKIFDPEKVYLIYYLIEDSFDSGVEEHKIYPMSGTGIENDFAILNNFGVIGYFDDLKRVPTRLKIKYNSNWKAGTSLSKDEDGYYYADSYYQLADSPILLGELSYATTMIGGINVDVFVRSPEENVNADYVMDLAEDVLIAAGKFLQFNPVDRYSFLMYFFDTDEIKKNGITGFGALEHSYSSTFASSLDKSNLAVLKGNMSHEFMHILTPLNLHSEIIEDFDYSSPSSKDKHLWLYEGVTEWVSKVLQFRGGNMSIEDYLKDVSRKINISEHFSLGYSLARLSSEWFTKEGSSQYGNIYFLGALTASLLDIKLLELSGGKRGLREVYLDLIKKYGKNKPFENDKFFDVFVDITYPEIKDFIDNYILDNKPLPIKEYYAKLGIKYIENRPAPGADPVFGIQLGSHDGEHLFVAGFTNEYKDYGLKKGDTILKVFGEELTIATASKTIERKNSMKPGDEYDMIIKRNGEELAITGVLFGRIDHHVLEVDENSTAQQTALRDAWSKNLN